MDRKEPEAMNETAALPSGQVGLKTMGTTEAVALYKAMVYSIALTHTSRRQDADDVFQEVFLAYHRKQPAFESEERRRGWLITTTLNCSRQVTGSSWARRVVPTLDSLPEPASDDDGFSFATAEQDAVFRAMQELPLSYRTVLHLFYFEDMSVAGVAEALGLEPGTVRVRLSRGRAMMRDTLEGAYFDE